MKDLKLLSKLFFISWIVIIASVLYAREVVGGVTEEQMWDTANLFRDACLPKYPKVSPEVADGIRNGIIPDEKDVNCYINCVLELGQIVKKGKLKYDAAIKQVDVLLPDDYRDEYYAGLTACKGISGSAKNKCDVAQKILVCLKREIKRFVFA